MAQQTIQLKAEWWANLTLTSTILANNWIPHAPVSGTSIVGDQPSIDANLSESGAGLRLESLTIINSGHINVALVGTGSSEDFTSQVEQDGAIRITIGLQSWVFFFEGSDLSDPYGWNPSNSSGAVAFYSASTSSVAATLEISDNPGQDFAIGGALDPVGFYFNVPNIVGVQTHQGAIDAVGFSFYVPRIGGVQDNQGEIDAVGFSFNVPNIVGSRVRDSPDHTASVGTVTFLFNVPDITGVLDNQEPEPADSFRRDAFGLDGRNPIFALEISHPSITDNIRVVNDTQDVTIEGDTYSALGFRPRLPQDRGEEIRQASIEVDNIGRRMVEWVEASNGGRGASMRIMEISFRNLGARVAEVVWELPAQMVGTVQMTNRVMRAALVDEGANRAPAVKIRHDPETSPGLF